MNKRLSQMMALALAATCGFQMMAKPAKQGIMTMPQADGTTINVRLAGDEFYHQYFTEDGYPLIEQGGFFYYGDIDVNGNAVNSGIKATQKDARSAEASAYLSTVDLSGLEARIQTRASKSTRAEAARMNRMAKPAREADGNDGPPYERGYGLFPDQRFPAYGDQKAIVILVEYTDVKFNTNYMGGVTAIDYFTRMLNEDGFSDYAATGCAAEYFRLNSGDSFRPEFDVYGPIELANNQAYYGGNDWWGNDQNPGAMVKEACDALDDTVDFNDYDRNHDGLVDNIFIFYAGRGEASGGADNTVWPHSWNMTSAGFSNAQCTYDGVRVYTYGCSNEWESGRPDGVGTFVHEFSHVMGLPDLYATSYTGAFTPGSWSALDYGPYNNDGMTPPLYGAFERYALGWLKPWEVDRAINATLPPISENVCGVIRTPKDTEFFLLENRQKESWDKYIPGHGMLIWHVDYDDYVWSSNKVNNTNSHQYCDIEEADGTQSEYTRDGDAFPGSANKTQFTSSTSPAMKTWNNTAIDFPITEIAENNGVITFKVLGGAEVEFPAMEEPSDPTDVTPDSFTLNWTPVEGYDVILNVYSRPDNEAYGPERLTGEEVYVPGFRNRNMGNASSVTINGLQESTIYYYTLALSTGWEQSDPTEEYEAFTGRRTLDYYKVNTLEATDVTYDSFVAHWEQLEDANDYSITVYELVPGDPFMDVCDFTDGVDKIGDWTSTSSMSYGMGAYAGEAIPALRMSNGSKLTSPVYEDGVKTLSFWHRGNNTSAADEINVYTVGDEGKELLTTVPVVKTQGGQVTECNEIPAGTKQVIIEFKRNGDKGALALDDVKVGHGAELTPVKLEAYDNLSVGNVDNHIVGDLKSNTIYGYTVLGTDGELVTRESKMQKVTTQMASAIKNVAEESGYSVSVSNMAVSCTTGDMIVVSDITGAVVARGNGKVNLPGAGLYVVTVPSKGFVKKVVVK